jgi:hypothetical protein
MTRNGRTRVVRAVGGTRIKLPKLRREGEMIVGRTRGRIARSPMRHHLRRLACVVVGHRWSRWSIDDMDGPGEEIGGGGFMPYLSRESKPHEFGTRSCKRLCGTSEARYPLADAPQLWKERMGC